MFILSNIFEDVVNCGLTAYFMRWLTCNVCYNLPYLYHYFIHYKLMSTDIYLRTRQMVLQPINSSPLISTLHSNYILFFLFLHQWKFYASMLHSFFELYYFELWGKDEEAPTMRIGEDIVNLFWEDDKNKMVWFEFIEKIDEGRNLFIVWLIYKIHS